MKGSLSETSFAELLQDIDSKRKSCILELTPARGGRTVRLYFQAARLLKVEVTRRERRDLLGEMLLRSGRITIDELNDALKRDPPPAGRANGFLGRSCRVCRSPSTEVLHGLFEWRKENIPLPAPHQIKSRCHACDAEQALMEGFTLLDEWPVIRAGVNNYSVVYRAMRSTHDEGAGH